MDRRRDPALIVGWALAAFHSTTLVVMLVTLLYLWAPVGELLAGLQTVVGLALYLVLWATTLWTNKHWPRDTRLTIDGTAINSSSFLRTSFKWGGVTGSVFFIALVILAVAAQTVPTSLFPLVIVLIGVIVAFVIGGITGCIFAFTDLALLRIARRVAR